MSYMTHDHLAATYRQSSDIQISQCISRCGAARFSTVQADAIYHHSIIHQLVIVTCELKVSQFK